MVIVFFGKIFSAMVIKSWSDVIGCWLRVVRVAPRVRLVNDSAVVMVKFSSMPNPKVVVMGYVLLSFVVVTVMVFGCAWYALIAVW